MGATSETSCVKPIYFLPQLYYLTNFLTIPKGICPAALPLLLPLPLSLGQ